MSHLHILEVVRRSEQGVTLPFLCRASDGHLYWVKGARAGKRALCCELVAGRIACDIGLPLPSFRSLLVSRDLVAQSARPDIRELGAGLVFGSQDLGTVQEFTVLDGGRVDAALRLKVLMFDWLVMNADRTLGERGGNPNLMWKLGEADGLRLIDHNMAFDPAFDAATFFEHHIFGAARNTTDRRVLLDVRQRMMDTVPLVETLWGEVPDEWRFVDAEQSVPVEFSAADIKTALERMETTFDMDWMQRP